MSARRGRLCPACDVEVQEVGASELLAEPRRLPRLARLKHLLGEVGYMDDAYTARRRGAVLHFQVRCYHLRLNEGRGSYPGDTRARRLGGRDRALPIT